MPAAPRSAAARAERTSARVALWTSLLLTAALGLALGRYSRPIPAAGFHKIEPEQAQWRGIDFLAFPEVQLLQRYVQIDTSHPEPDEVAGAEFLAAQLAAAGIPSTIERFADRRANLWAFVEGDDPRALVLNGHLDVEPALEQKGWNYPPFGGVVEGPWIYGRGMYDMKSLTIAQLLATIDAAKAGRRPKRSLLFLQTSSEETGSLTGTRWILDEHPELVARMDTVLAEGGVVEAISPSEVKYWGIEFAQRRNGRVTFCSPDRQTLVDLRKLLIQTGKGDPVPDLDPSVERFLAHYTPTRDLELYPLLLAEPRRVPLQRGLFDKLTPFLQSLFRNQLVPLWVQRDPEGGYRLDVWLHLLPGQDLEAVARELLPEWKTAGVAATRVELVGEGLASPLDHADYRTIESTVRARFPGTPVGPFFLVQAMTDAQRFRSAGLRAYGFSPFPVVVFDTVQIARPNERMQLPAYRVGVELYRETVRALLD
jgi:acetylornithine deacetylase/succinyl-diaminopimelate desuccinylase-like protein